MTKGKRVLVAEDEYLIRLLLTDELREAGVDVLEAGCGDDALKLLDAPDNIAAVVTDIQMPGLIDGIALAAAARERHPDIRVVFTTAAPQYLAAPHVPRPHHAMHKPYDVIRLVQLVIRLLSNEPL